MTLFAKKYIAAPVIAGLFAGTAFAHGPDDGGIKAEKGNAEIASFDIVHAKISTEGSTALFHMGVSKNAGKSKPAPTGQLAGSDVFSYVWPTTINAYEVGFDKDAGILAFAVTSHPDFDDTPLFDENGDGRLDNDGDLWHSHWVVLTPDEACGPGSLKVKDIPEGAKPRLPKTWPGLPLHIDSPGWSPVITGDTVEVRVPFENIGAVENTSFDGVTSGLRVNESVHAPLLCVVNVFDVASGDLSLSGKVNQ
ncbi:hypothetical protein JCM17844_21570 [Iodidimonas gelatinilytica]|uniref:Uncharacterized protein n=1 Tax=Iodidimonas gelatinilytica TaxID=1236966 RepID=A0A5A7MR54_9PROT|nr:hypothetical protein [Iodidimonas gelatinilytica]GEQ98520.1 hypothetical protein JCM17844_21570 [Iodidimonas gelatinilytica]